MVSHRPRIGHVLEVADALGYLKAFSSLPNSPVPYIPALGSITVGGAWLWPLNLPVTSRRAKRNNPRLPGSIQTKAAPAGSSVFEGGASAFIPWLHLLDFAQRLGRPEPGDKSRRRLLDP